MPHPSRKKRSPGRPRQGTLTRERVLEEALAVMDREGLEALTMRSLADHLRVTPMALYNHVRNKKDLLGSVAEHLTGRIDFECDAQDWRDRIRTCFRRLRDACLAHPSAVRLMEHLEVAPLAVFRPMEITLVALEDAGLLGEDAVRTYFLLMNFTMGQISYEVRGPFQALDPAHALAGNQLDGPEFAHVQRSVSPGKWDFDRAFEFGLSVILRGVEQSSVRQSRPRRARTTGVL
jgi:TetR/AcrR family transcriptional regulator, tetracycline repressor protein